MSSKGGYAAVPPRQGGDRFYNPPVVRRHQQMLIQQQQQQQRQLQRRSRVKAESSSSKEEAEKQTAADDSSTVVALSAPRSISDVSTLKITNLDRLMESVTPFIEARYLSEGNAKGLRMPSLAFFYLEDLWDSFSEWSVYGAGVPLLLNGRDPIKQYYVPFLSGIQLYIDPSKPSSRLGGSHEEIGAGSSGYEGNGSAISAVSSASSEADTSNSLRLPLFQFLEHEQPYNRRPLTDKISMLASEYPELVNCRSCDLLPTSWICVAWYPIYRIPIGPTLQDLDASFLTFHYLSTQSTSACTNLPPTPPKKQNKADNRTGAGSSPQPQFHGANTRKARGFACPSAEIPLPVFALASYKLKGLFVSPCGPHERDQENRLLQAADKFLRGLKVVLPDFQFFHSHHSQRK